MTNFLTTAQLRIIGLIDTLKHEGIGALFSSQGSLATRSRRGVGRLLQYIPSAAIRPAELPPLVIASLSFVILMGGGIGLLAVTADDPNPIPAPVVWMDIVFPDPSVHVGPENLSAHTEPGISERASPGVVSAHSSGAVPSAYNRAPDHQSGAPVFRPAILGDEIALPRAPDPALIIETKSGLLPVIAPDGREAWRVYARPFSDPFQRPRISILLGGLGMSQSATLTAIQQLPGAVTLSFNPYAQKLQDWIDQSRAAGHEVMLELPMEPMDYPDDDPGPHTLLTSMDANANLEQTEWLLGRVVGYVGVTNYMGSRFTASAEALRPVLQSLQNRGLMFLDTGTSSHSVAGQVADEVGLVQAANNRFIDTKASRAAIDARLAELERMARARGSAIGVAFPYPVSIERIAAWAETLERRGLTLAPISNLAARGTMSASVAEFRSSNDAAAPSPSSSHSTSDAHD